MERTAILQVEFSQLMHKLIMQVAFTIDIQAPVWVLLAHHRPYIQGVSEVLLMCKASDSDAALSLQGRHTLRCDRHDIINHLDTLQAITPQHCILMGQQYGARISS